MNEPTIAIIGAGVSGLCMAMQLRRAGIDSFTIFDAGDRLGGTWRDNTYPGAGCDVPSHLYCYSFEPNPEWSRKFADQAEILAYLERCADKYDLRRFMRFHTAVTGARFDESLGTWQLTLAPQRDGGDAGSSTFEARFVVFGCGQLSVPSMPDIEGIDTFEGPAFHSARWDHDAGLRGHVGVIGNGASAVQLVPPVAEQARHLTLFQRSANWVVPKPDRPYFKIEKWLFRRLDWWRRLHRYRIFWALEGRFFAFEQGSRINRWATRLSQAEIDTITDADLRAKLQPHSTVGCKRILISNDFFETLQRPDVTVIDDPIVRITPGGVETERGLTELDALIFATGFHSTSFLGAIDIECEGSSLASAWRHGAEAYLGMAIAGFPNLFMLYGPNTNLGHNSIIFMVECQVHYILQCIRGLTRREARYMVVTDEAMAACNERLQRELAATVWAGECRNWYKNAAGKITNNWSSFCTAYWWQTRWPDFSAFELHS